DSAAAGGAGAGGAAAGGAAGAAAGAGAAGAAPGGRVLAEVGDVVDLEGDGLELQELLAEGVGGHGVLLPFLAGGGAGALGRGSRGWSGTDRPGAAGRPGGARGPSPSPRGSAAAAAGAGAGGAAAGGAAGAAAGAGAAGAAPAGQVLAGVGDVLDLEGR